MVLVGSGYGSSRSGSSIDASEYIVTHSSWTVDTTFVDHNDDHDDDLFHNNIGPYWNTTGSVVAVVVDAAGVVVPITVVVAVGSNTVVAVAAVRIDRSWLNDCDNDTDDSCGDYFCGPVEFVVTRTVIRPRRRRRTMDAASSSDWRY